VAGGGCPCLDYAKGERRRSKEISYRDTLRGGLGKRRIKSKRAKWAKSLKSVIIGAIQTNSLFNQKKKGGVMS